MPNIQDHSAPKVPPGAFDPWPVCQLDCSQIDSPKGFWALYVDQLKPAGADSFGRNLDALWDALSAEGPGWAGSCQIEVTNVARLEAKGHGDFVDALGTIGTELAAARLNVSLRVLGCKG